MSVFLLALLIALASQQPEAQSGDPDPVFEASGFQKNRPYFSQLPFENIDMVSGNLILTFTDLVLPGNAGMDLRFQRTYNLNGRPKWSFGLAGMPLIVRQPDGPSHCDAGAKFPGFITADGGQRSGDLYAWIMDGHTLTGSRHLNPITRSDLNWMVRGSGDFNGDGLADLLWHNRTTGYVEIWLMGDDGANLGTSYMSSALAYPSPIDPVAWRIVGVGDFNADGKTDIVWQEQTYGYLAVWLMEGTTLMPGGSVSMSPDRVTDTNWKIVGVGDYNRDGKPDLLWRDTTPGGQGWIGIWLMNGVSLASSVAPTPAAQEKHPLEWRIVGPR